MVIPDGKTEYAIRNFKSRADFLQISLQKNAAVKAIHAGLECGIIGERCPGMDMVVSFGPTMEGVHSPDERLHIDTVDKFWKFLLTILKNVKSNNINAESDFIVRLCIFLSSLIISTIRTYRMQRKYFCTSRFE